MREFRASDGAAVRAFLEQRLSERGCPKVNLIVWDGNAAAMGGLRR